jgi:hypothetical protein
VEPCRGCALQWDRLDLVVDAAAARGMRVLLVLAYMFGPPSQTPPCGELAYVRSVMVEHGDTVKKISGTDPGTTNVPAPASAGAWVVISPGSSTS